MLAGIHEASHCLVTRFKHERSSRGVMKVKCQLVLYHFAGVLMSTNNTSRCTSSYVLKP